MMLSQEVNNGVDIKSYKKLAQLSIAIESYVTNKESVVERILKKEGDINYQLPATDLIKSHKPHLIGCTALHLTNGKHEYQSKLSIGCFEAILKNGANCTVTNAKGLTAINQLFKSTYNRYKDDWNAQSDDKQIPRLYNKYLDSIINERCFLKSVLSACVDAGIFTHRCDHDGVSLLHAACMTGNAKALEYYLRNGVSPNQAIDSESKFFPGYTPLHFTAISGDVELTKILLQYGADPALKNGRQMAALHIAIDRYMEIVDYLHVKRRKIYPTGFETDIDNFNEVIRLIASQKIAGEEDDLTFFHALCTLKDSSLACQCLENGQVDVNLAIKSDSPVWPGYTPLHFAAHFNAETLKLLLDKGANIEVEDVYGVTPLDICVERFKIEDIHYFISSHSKWKHIVLSNGKTKLVDLVEAMQSAELLDSFLDNHSVDVNSFIPTDSTLWPGYSILHVAVMFTETIQIFTDPTVENDIDSNDRRREPLSDSEAVNDNASDDTNWGPSIHSCGSFHEHSSTFISAYISKLKVCLNQGADVTAQDAFGTSPLHLAFRMRIIEVMRLMIKFHSKTTNPTDKDGLSHLYIACYAKNLRLIKKLVLNGAEVNSPLLPTFKWFKNEKSYIYKYKSSSTQRVGTTPLHVIAMRGGRRKVRLLLKYGADVNAKDCQGKTPISYIPISYTDYSSNTQYAGELLSCPNLRQCTFNDGELISHLHIAASLNESYVVEKLLDAGAEVNATAIIEKTTNNLDIDDNIVEKPNIFLLADFADKSDGSLTPFHVAMMSHSYNVVKLLFQRGADFFMKNTAGWSAFHLGLEYCIGRYSDEESYTGRERNMIVSALENDVSLQKRMEEASGVTMLHMACLTGNVDMIKDCLSRGLNVNAQVHSDSPVWPGWTPLHVLVDTPRYRRRKGEIESAIKILLEYNADLTLKDTKYATALHLTVTESSTDLRNRHLQDADQLLRGLNNFKVNPTNIEGISHFHIACLVNNTEVVWKYLQDRVDVNQSVDFFSSVYPGCMALHFAVSPKASINMTSRLETIDLLLYYGTDINAEDAKGNTPLHVAARCKAPRKAIFERLACAGADIKAQNIYGETPMEVLMKSRNVTHEDVDFFLIYNYNFNTYNPLNNEGYTSLIFPDEYAYGESTFWKSLVDRLVSSYDVSTVDEAGRTIIHNIVSTRENKKWESIDYAIKELTKKGCDIDHQDASGRTALQTAVLFTNHTAIRVLLDAGADVNISDVSGATAFTMAIALDPDQKWTRNNGDIDKYMAMHVCQMQILGLPVTEVNYRALMDLPAEYREHEEIDRFRNMGIATDLQLGSLRISLYDFLSDTGMLAAYPMMNYADRLTIDEFFNEPKNDEVLRKFDIFKGRIKSQYGRFRRRLAMIEPSTEALKKLLGFPLPDLCCEVIFRFLSSKDLENLIKSQYTVGD